MKIATLSSGERRRESRRRAVLIATSACVLLLAQAALATPGAELWTKRYDGPSSGEDFADDIGITPDGSTVFVTGSSSDDVTGNDFTTVAYDAFTGVKQWVTRYDGPANADDGAAALAVSPDGSKVFVTGGSDGGATTTGHDFATVAYDASSGNELWTKRYDSPVSGLDSAFAIGVSPDGSAVFVTGSSDGGSTLLDYATLAYDASTGGKLWVKRYNGVGNGDDVPRGLRLSPDGSEVFVTGESYGGSTTRDDYATVAYDTSSGNELWTKRYNGRSNRGDGAFALGVSPDSSAVFVTGRTARNYATVVYDAPTGAMLWVKRYDGPASGVDLADTLGVSPDGSRVFVSGYSDGGSVTRFDYATIAYNASTGARQWVERYDGPANSYDSATTLGVSPDGSTVFVSGSSDGGVATDDDFATVAYDASTGARQWVKRYDGPGNLFDHARSLAVSPDGSVVFVTGESYGGTSTFADYATVAYDTA